MADKKTPLKLWPLWCLIRNCYALRTPFLELVSWPKLSRIRLVAECLWLLWGNVKRAQKQNIVTNSKELGKLIRN